MTVEQFFNLFLKELENRDKLRGYYKFHDGPAKLPFRKAYFCQRLQYVLDHVRARSRAHPLAPSPLNIWDCGCGYATTQIFLALNGIPSRGTTLEFYYQEIPERLRFWEKHGDMGLLKVSYEDVFETKVPENSEDVIIVQDTLHHLEPLQDSLRIFHRTLRPGGILLAIEENGANLVQRLKLYRYRGRKRIIEYYDEGLGRMVVMGNENIRPFGRWKAEMEKAGFAMLEAETQYVRLFPPPFFNKKPLEEVVEKEQAIWRKHPLLREYFFFGINFIARK